MNLLKERGSSSLLYDCSPDNVCTVVMHNVPFSVIAVVRPVSRMVTSPLTEEAVLWLATELGCDLSLARLG